MIIGIEKHQVAKAIAKYDNVRGRTVTRSKDMINQIYTEIKTGALSSFSTEIYNMLNLSRSTSVQKTATVKEQIIALLKHSDSSLTAVEIANYTNIDKRALQSSLLNLTKSKDLCRSSALGQKNQKCYAYSLFQKKGRNSLGEVA